MECGYPNDVRCSLYEYKAELWIRVRLLVEGAAKKAVESPLLEGQIRTSFVCEISPAPTYIPISYHRASW